MSEVEKPKIPINDFFSADIRVGTVTRAYPLPNARRPAIVMEIDFGSLGILKTSAQVTKRYTPDRLVNTQIVALVNIAPVQIGSIMSECLVLGVLGESGDVILLRPDQSAKNGSSVA